MTKCYRKINMRGYTMVEMMISLGMFTVIIGSLCAVLLVQNNFLEKTNARIDTQQAARKVMNNMVKELRTSKIDFVDLYAEPLNVSAVLNHINAKSISFQTPVDPEPDGDYFDEYGRIEWGADNVIGLVIEYFWDEANKRILRRVWDASGTALYTDVIAENISNFRIQGFRWNSTANAYESIPANYVRDVIEITVTVEKTSAGGRVLASPISYTLKNRVTWRN